MQLNLYSICSNVFKNIFDLYTLTHRSGIFVSNPNKTRSVFENTGATAFIAVQEEFIFVNSCVFTFVAKHFHAEKHHPSGGRLYF